MTDDTETLAITPRAHADVAAERTCLCCRKTFWSEGFGERVCSKCKSSKTWRTSVTGGMSQGHRRSSRRTS